MRGLGEGRGEREGGIGGQAGGAPGGERAADALCLGADDPGGWRSLSFHSPPGGGSAGHSGAADVSLVACFYCLLLASENKRQFQVTISWQAAAWRGLYLPAICCRAVLLRRFLPISGDPTLDQGVYCVKYVLNGA